LAEVFVVIDSENGLEAKFTLERERGGVIEEPPFRILVVGDWTGDAEKNDLRSRRPIEIDRDNFDDILRKFRPRLAITGSDQEELSFGSLDDFHPDRIFEQLPSFERLRDLRRRLLSSDEFDRAAGEVRSWFKVDEPSRPESDNRTPQPAIESSDNLLDAILSGSSAAVSTARQPGASDDISELVRDLVRPHLVSVDESEQAALLAAVDAATSDLMGRVLHDHRFQALEAAWRGLYLLVRRAETSTELKIYVYDLSHDELANDLKAVSDLSDSTLYNVLVTEAIEIPGAEPWALVAGNYAFLPNKDDIAALMRIAKVCAAANAPLVSHMRPDVIGISSLAEQRDPSTWDMSTNNEAGKLWTILRGIPEAGYLGMAIPRFLSRLPYGNETDPVETFQFEEFSGTPSHDEYLWSNSCFIAALLLAQSFGTYGWQMDRRFIQDIERLPMHMYESDGETIYQPCAEVLLTQFAAERLMEYGLMPLVSYKNTDHVKLARFQSIADPVTGLRGRWSS